MWHLSLFTHLDELITIAQCLDYQFVAAANGNVVPGDNKNPSRLKLTETFVWQSALNSLTDFRQQRDIYCIAQQQENSCYCQH